MLRYSREVVGNESPGLCKDGMVVDRLHREGCEPPDMAKWQASKQDKAKLGELFATGVAGNNITSSCLYVIALAAIPAGKYTPIALLFISFVLYLFRSIYEESIMAFPVNGGTYNVILNVVSKKWAALAACLTMLSYVTTAVISSSSAIAYLFSYSGQPDQWILIVSTIGLLTLCALLNLWGITESAFVSCFLFTFHVLTMSVLIITSLAKAFSDMPEAPNGKNMMEYNIYDTNPPHNIFTALFYGYSSGLLAISGFESSSNFVEQQEPGVFPKTLRNMWAVVSVMNVSLAVLAMCLLPMDGGHASVSDSDTIPGQGESGALLAMMGKVAAGSWLELWVILDAALVLTGAVLTAFVGYTGVTTRMAMDSLMPEMLVHSNSWFGTRHWIVLSFWTLTTLLTIFSSGSLEIMGGIYTLAFLCVMGFFALGNMLIKVYRSEQPTSDVRASWPAVMTAFLFMVLGWFGNMLSRDPLAVIGFFAFSALFIVIAQSMIKMPDLLDQYASAVDMFAEWCSCCKERMHTWSFSARATRYELQTEPVIFFTKDSDPAALHEATQYLLENEHQRHIVFITAIGKEANEDPDGPRPAIYDLLLREFPELAQIDFCTANDDFTPDFVKKIAMEYKIPKQHMYMGAFSDKFPFTYTELGGIRLIASCNPKRFQERPDGADSSEVPTMDNPLHSAVATDSPNGEQLEVTEYMGGELKPENGAGKRLCC